MFRRGISSLLVVGYVAMQMAAAPHAHPADPFHLDHSTAPHIHVSWFGGVDHGDRPHHHGHHHSHDRHGHHHCHAPYPNAPPDGTARVEVAADGHKGDAIYLPTGTSAGHSTDTLQRMMPTDKALISFDADDLTPPALGPLTLAARHAQLRPSGSRCALFLELRTLRV